MSISISLHEEEVRYIPIVISFERPFTAVCSYLEKVGAGVRSPQRIHYLLEHILRSIFMPYEWSQAIELNLATACGNVMDDPQVRDKLVQTARFMSIATLEDIIENILVSPTKYRHYYDGRDNLIPNVVVFAPSTIFAPAVPSDQALMTESDVLLRISEFSSHERIITQNRRYRQPGNVEVPTVNPQGSI